MTSEYQNIGGTLMRDDPEQRRTMLKNKGQSPRLGKPFNQSEVYLTIQTVRKFGKTDIFRAQ